MPVADVVTRVRFILRLATAALAVTALVGLVYHQMRRHLDALAWMEHTTDVRRLLVSELAAVQDVDSGARGYILGGDARSLDPVPAAGERARRDVRDLERLIADNPGQQTRLYAVMAAVSHVLGSADAAIDAERIGNHAAALAALRNANFHQALEKARVQLHAMDAVEQQLLTERRARAAHTRKWAAAMLWLAALLGVSPIVLWIRGIRRETRVLAETTTRLGASENKFRLLADHATDLVLLQEREGRALYVSPSSERLLGYLPEEMMRPDSALVFVHPDDRSTLAGHAEAVMSSRDPSTAVRFRFKNKQGQYRWFESRTYIVEDPETRQVLFQTTARDVHDQVMAEQGLARSREIYRTLVKNLPKTAVVIYDKGLICRLADGPDLDTMLGIPKERVGGLPVADVLSPDNRDMTRPIYEGALEGRPGELEVMRGEHVMNVMLLPLAVEGIEPMGLAVVRDMTEERRIEDLLAKQAEELRSLSLRDELTGLANRRGFVTVAGQYLKMAARGRRPLAVVFVDLNGMKPINDSLGHQAGDEALKDTAKILRSTFRDSDIVGRLGGDEFAVLVNDIRQEDVRFVLSRLDAAVERHNLTAGRAYRISLSVGVAAEEPTAASSIEDLLATADSRMYEDKRARKLERGQTSESPVRRAQTVS